MHNCLSPGMPFLKWAGGKRWLVSEYRYLFPERVERLIEPFVGSGAVFFEIEPEEAILGDSNLWLIQTYMAIQTDWERVVRCLKIHARRHCPEYYYNVRKKKPTAAYAIAANLIYLNRTCWNGLFRVNLNGQFNVPIGTKESIIRDTDDFANLSAYLRRAKLVCADFEETISRARPGDLIYADPPYLVRHGNNGFVKYNERLFTWEDQIRLCECLKEAYERGCKIIASNARHRSIRDLYNNWANLQILRRPSMIAGNNEARGVCEEYLISAM